MFEVGKCEGNELHWGFVFIGGFNILKEVLFGVALFESFLENILIEDRKFFLFDLKSFFDWINFDNSFNVFLGFFHF